LKDVAKQIREKEKENKNSTPSRPTLNKIVVRATIGGAYYCSLSKAGQPHASVWFQSNYRIYLRCKAINTVATASIEDIWTGSHP